MAFGCPHGYEPELHGGSHDRTVFLILGIRRVNIVPGSSYARLCCQR